jgi:tRNA dimethylallyltransferase
MNNKVVIIVGPTGTGKTETTVELCQKLPAEIISADSRQVYKYLTIGTNKPIGKWIEGIYIYKNIPYHLVDFLEPHLCYDANKFYNDASDLINKIWSKNKIPFIVGGTGLYIKTITEGITILPKKDERIRNYLIQLANLYGKNYLYNMLKTYDPQRAKEVHPNNIQRIIRSLEIILQTGKPFTQIVTENPKTKSYDTIIFGLYYDKKILFNRIVERTKQMFQNGIIEETKQLLSKGVKETAPVFSSIGYRWVIKFINNEISFEETQKSFIKDTMDYIKRQIVWFKKDKNIQWINCGDMSIKDIVNFIYEATLKNLSL